jgi:hypothetical protein
MLYAGSNQNNSVGDSSSSPGIFAIINYTARIKFDETRLASKGGSTLFKRVEERETAILVNLSLQKPIDDGTRYAKCDRSK